MKLDILAFGAHPDDVELACGGTIIKHVDLGYKVGIIDLTEGELSSRGTIELRREETKAASELMGIHARENLGFADGFFINDKTHQLEIIKMIRKYQPQIVITNAENDRHPDHPRACKLVKEACFLAGLSKIETRLNGDIQKEWRPKNIYSYIQSYELKPDLIIDISGYENRKMDAILCYTSQFYNPNSTEKDTFISGKEFLEFIKAKMQIAAKLCGTSYAEPFTCERTIATDNLFTLF